MAADPRAASGRHGSGAAGDAGVDPDGRYLAFDTSGSGGSVAVGAPGEVLAEEPLGSRRTHAADLLPAIDAVLSRAATPAEELDGIVVGRGPGSFTGVRVAAGTAKGLVRALGVPLFGLSSLAAAAVDAALRRGGLPAPADPALHVCVLFDARQDRVYAACYRISRAGLEPLMEPTAARLKPVLDETMAGDVRFAGDGARRHHPRIEERGWTVLPEPAGTPGGGALLALLALAPGDARIADPGTWEPEYLRESRVQLSRGP